ncbi:MAG: 50S ribosomal protein L24 [Acidimicrobiaceae bacterium]|nr:50S ribosomal protein L24 [Acidimicrobiaceae bacterium]MBT5579118.1 50S ribosomal protein L24 [Acidimicrobiaceae bacterium]MBT5849452.1 50S ribosomal protein L24 [Acidimicrobiaceae bacterium]MDG1412420.1 50S ribosomal protein L24 [Acidimicrobiales bacterium]MDG2216532.1 50S ribosomal protein L24 [Acidimicrobiales bacterium]
MKIIKGDRVVVLSGKDKGSEGVVERAIPEAGKVIVDGVNIAKKHQAPTSGDQQGGIIDRAMPIDVSNVAVVSPKDGKATRVGYKINADGTKVRFCKRTGAELS